MTFQLLDLNKALNIHFQNACQGLGFWWKINLNCLFSKSTIYYSQMARWHSARGLWCHSLYSLWAVGSEQAPAENSTLFSMNVDLLNTHSGTESMVKSNDTFSQTGLPTTVLWWVKLYIQRSYKQGDYSHLPISKKGFLKEGGFLKVLTAPERRPAGRCGQRRWAQPRQWYGGEDKAQAWGPTVDLPAKTAGTSRSWEARGKGGMNGKQRVRKT